MGGEIFQDLNHWAFFSAVALLFFAVAEIAFLFGRHKVAEDIGQKITSNTANFGTSILGLLALLLGFAFAMALGRFEASKEALINEVNDIRVAYMRADLLPDKQRDEVRNLFAEYTHLRLKYYGDEAVYGKTTEDLNNAQAVQKRIWDIAVATIKNPNENEVENSQVLSFMTALNNIFDDMAKRTAVRNDHIPDAILWLLIFVAACAIGINAYSLGLAKHRLYVPCISFIVSVAMVLTIIMDLDSPARGIVRVNQQAMQNLHDGIAKDIAP